MCIYICTLCNDIHIHVYTHYTVYSTTHISYIYTHIVSIYYPLLTLGYYLLTYIHSLYIGGIVVL